MRCDSCGYDNPPEASFCANCGSRLTDAAQQPAPAAIPFAGPTAPEVSIEYMGFWIRFVAALIDTIILNIVIFSFSTIGGIRFMFTAPFWIFFPWLYYWLFTGLKGQTLGKMALGIKVVNTEGLVPGLGTAALREIPGKIISSIVIFLGFFWIMWDGQKQGWHDKIAKTYVVRTQLKR